MPSIAELLKLCADIDSDTPLLDAQVLLGYVLDCSRTHLYTWPEKMVAPVQEDAYLRLLERRKRGEPIAHLVERQDFWSLSLKVSAATLIPRADTELLVEKALELDLPASSQVLDLGTGTGAIALALAVERPEWQITAVDRESAAVELAMENLRHNKIGNVQVEHSDWFSAVEGRFNLVVSNPPYIDPEDPHLWAGDVRHEPRTALVAENGGLADLEIIITAAKDYLVDKGWLLVEHGYDQASRVQQLFRQAGFNSVCTFNDLGDQPRVTVGQLFC